MAGYGDDQGFGGGENHTIQPRTVNMRTLVFSLFAVIAFTGCASGWDGMTAEQRRTYNTGPFQPECLFDEMGAPHRDRCNDFRLINHKGQVRRADATLLTGEGFYVKPSSPDFEHIEIPAGLAVQWYDRVSKTEVACYQLMKRTTPRPLAYPTACYDPIFKVAHVTYGDWLALKHEIRHHNEGRFHE